MSARAAIYLDSNAGAPLRPEVVEALLPFLQDSWGVVPNPSSVHGHGRRARRALFLAREQVARSLGSGLDPQSLTFTSSGTEANQLAIRSVLEPMLHSGQRTHWILSAVEHDSVLRCVSWFEARGGTVSYLPVSAEGEFLWELLPGLLRPETALVSIIYVNNETGVISRTPRSVQELLSGRSIPIHWDAAQAWGKLELDLLESGVSFAALSAHKIGALAGTGILWSRVPRDTRASIFGLQEFERRGGTENLLGAVAAGAAAMALRPLEWASEVRLSRERLERKIREKISGANLQGGKAERIANTSNWIFTGIPAGLVPALDLEGYSVSSGSACSSGVAQPSHVLMAMGRSEMEAKAAVRISLGRPLDEATEIQFVDAISRSVDRLRVR